MALAAFVIGTIWPFPYFVFPIVGLFFTIIFSQAAGLFFITLSPSGAMPSFGSYLISGGLTGFLALIIAVIEIQALCRVALFSQNHMCTAPIALEGFAIGAYGLYVFLFVAIYFLLK
ncbi:MAG TPA: hypothetical protein ENK60_01715 [Anaerolineae bacterium]|nr:hypothetical protein [Anaerolineae bacterium]